MTHEQETALHNFEALVRQLMTAYQEEKRRSAALREELEVVKLDRENAKREIEKLRHDYDVLKTARMLEVSGDDVKTARSQMAKLIREVDKCIALLDV